MKHLHLPALPPVGGAERFFQKGNSLRAEHSAPLGDEGTGAHPQGPGPSPEESRVSRETMPRPYRATVHARGSAGMPRRTATSGLFVFASGRLRNDGTVAKDLGPCFITRSRKQTVRPCFPSGRPAMIGLAVSCREPFTTVARCGRRRPGSAAARVMHYEDQTTTRIGLITGRWRANRADKRL